MPALVRMCSHPIDGARAGWSYGITSWTFPFGTTTFTKIHSTHIQKPLLARILIRRMHHRVFKFIPPIRAIHKGIDALVQIAHGYTRRDSRRSCVGAVMVMHPIALPLLRQFLDRYGFFLFLCSVMVAFCVCDFPCPILYL